MLGKVYKANFERCYPKRLKRMFQQGVQYKTYKNFVPQTENATVGNLPNEIIRLFSPDEKAEKIKSFKTALSDMAKYIREIHDEDMVDIKHDDKFCIDNILDSRGIYANKMLNKKLENILPAGYKAWFEYVDYGGFKDVYKFNIKDVNNKKIMHDKAFHIYQNLSETNEFGTQHGVWAEPNMWVYLSYRAGHSLNKTPFTKHYISDLHAGYSMTEYSDFDITKTTKPLMTQYILGMKYGDLEHNPLLHNKIYDVGGFKKMKYFTDDKMVMRYYKQIFNRNTEKEKQQVIAQLEEKIKNPKTPHRDKMAKGICLYKTKAEDDAKRERELLQLL